jgi:hypothetical protein
MKYVIKIKIKIELLDEKVASANFKSKPAVKTLPSAQIKTTRISGSLYSCVNTFL